jgi:5-methylthioadenosine/S-adenosylhomocysteine deaminase
MATVRRGAVDYTRRVTTRIRSERVLLHTPDGPRIAPATLVITPPYIAAVLVGEAPDAADEDLGTRLISPAFVDAHTHLALSFMRGIDARTSRANLVEDLYFHFESLLSPGDVRAFARLGAYESLLHGVGMVWDHYYAGLEVADALADTGLTGVVAPTLQDLGGPGRAQSDQGLHDTLAIARSAPYRAQGVYAALGPHATDTVSPALFRRVVELAEGEALPIHLHVAQSVDEVERVEAREGRSPLALLHREGVLSRPPHVLMAHGIFAPTSDLALLDPERHTLAFCPSSQAQFGMPAVLPELVRKGVRWVVASDCASSNDSLNLQKELRACVLVAACEITYAQAQGAFLAGGDARDAAAVRAARREATSSTAAELAPERLLARVLDMPGSMHPACTAGVLRAGALANIVAWDTHHPAFFPGRDPLRALALGDTTGAIHGLWCAGRAIGQRGDFARSLLSSHAYRDARIEAERRHALLLQRAGC